MPSTGYSSIATVALSGLTTATLSGFSGYDYRIVYNGNPGGAGVAFRPNNNTDTFRYNQGDWRVISGSSQTFTSTSGVNSYINLFTRGQNIAGFSTSIIDLMNPTSTSASPPRNHHGWIKSGSANSGTTGTYSYLTGWNWQNSDVGITSCTFFIPGGGTFGATDTLTLFEIGPL
jgi:hypothetical protein